MSTTASSLEPLFTLVAQSYETLETAFYKVPGSAVIARYVKSSHRDDPGRTLLEVILIIFAIRTLLQSRTKAEASGKHFIEFSEKASAEVSAYRRVLPFNRKLTSSSMNGLRSHSRSPSTRRNMLSLTQCLSSLARRDPSPSLRTGRRYSTWLATTSPAFKATSLSRSGV